MIYIPSFIKTGSGTEKLIEEIHRQHGDRISLLLFFKSNESRLKIEIRFRYYIVTLSSFAKLNMLIPFKAVKILVA
jgi:hypothetical protein